MMRLLKRINQSDESDDLSTIRETPIIVDQVHHELMIRTPHQLILDKYPALDKQDIEAVWFYKASQNSRRGVIDRQELISSMQVFPEKVTILEVFDHVDFIFMIQERVTDIDGKTTPHEQVMRELREYSAQLKASKNL